MEEQRKYFDGALSDFTHDVASGGAIRHLVDLGYSVDQIMRELYFPTPRERVERTVYRYMKESGLLVSDFAALRNGFPAQKRYGLGRGETAQRRDGSDCGDALRPKEGLGRGEAAQKRDGLGRGETVQRRDGLRRMETSQRRDGLGRGETVWPKEYPRRRGTENVAEPADFTGQGRLDRQVGRIIEEPAFLPQGERGYSFRRVDAAQLKAYLLERSREDGQENSYVSCPFGILRRQGEEVLAAELSCLNSREKEYILGIPWENQMLYHQLNGRMLDIGTKLAFHSWGYRFYFLAAGEAVEAGKEAGSGHVFICPVTFYTHGK